MKNLLRFLTKSDKRSILKKKQRGKGRSQMSTTRQEDSEKRAQQQSPRRRRRRRRRPIWRAPLVAALLVLALVLLLQGDVFQAVTGLFWETGSGGVDSSLSQTEGERSETVSAEEPNGPDGVANTPNGQGSGLVVCIDPGHGGNDKGCIYQGAYESDQNLELALAVRDAMVRRGIQVVMTRTDDTYVALEERANIANQAGADFFLSLHRNSLETGQASGIEIWHSSRAGSDTIAYAQCVEQHLIAAGVSKSRGCRGGSQTDPNEDYAVCRLTTMPAVLVEMGFMTDETDNRLFETNMEAYAEAFADAVLESWAAGQAG